MTTNKKSKIKRSVVFPIIMFVYLAVMAWIGRDRLERGEYLYYFGIIGVSLLIIVLLYFSLRRKEQLQQRREEQEYGTYNDDEGSSSTNQDQETDDKA